MFVPEAAFPPIPNRILPDKKWIGGASVTSLGEVSYGSPGGRTATTHVPSPGGASSSKALASPSPLGFGSPTSEAAGGHGRGARGAAAEAPEPGDACCPLGTNFAPRLGDGGGGGGGEPPRQNTVKQVPMVMVTDGSVWPGFDYGLEDSGGTTITRTGGTASDGASVAGQSIASYNEDDRRPRALPIALMPVLSRPVVAPFSQQACGCNLDLSEGGYVVSRRCGCRDSVAIGSSPLDRQARGLYFEVELRQTVDGWLGGLGIGVTHTPPGRIGRLPDKAWRIPETFIVGYSGSLYLNGGETKVEWQPDTLKAGQRIGLLVTGDGRESLAVFVDGREELRIDGARLHEAGLRDAPLYPVVDVFNASQSLLLLARAVAPGP